jgi:hypothetical protein
VRKNAALAVLNIHHNFGQELLPDGAELIERFIKVGGGGLRPGCAFRRRSMTNHSCKHHGCLQGAPDHEASGVTRGAEREWFDDLQAETDMGARRNAFLMLCSEAEASAIEYLSEHLEEVPKYGDGFALLVLELTRKVCRKDPAQKARFIKYVHRSDSRDTAGTHSHPHSARA